MTDVHTLDGDGRTSSGTGYAGCHHGEILQGVFLDARGRRRAALVTLPLTGLGTRADAVLRPDAPPGSHSVNPPDRTKALRAAVLALRECRLRRPQTPLGGLELRLSGDVPVGLGMGSSSSDVIAAVRAVADACGLRLPSRTVARIAVRAERASDPLMLDGRPLLFAQREGRILEVLGDALPPAVVVGCALGAGRPVDTLALPSPARGDDDVRAYERLRSLLRRALAEKDTRLLGHVSTESARRAQRVLRQPEFDRLTRVAERTGAVGVQIAHSGCVAGLLFDPAATDLEARLRRCVSALDRDGIPVTRTFTTHTPAEPIASITSFTPNTAVTTTEESRHGRAHRRRDRTAGPDSPGRRSRLSAL
ncbi:kinase [Streptomyces camponoticapitis]|uniref:Kinase n=1 Tax=Streptomyces camponoticapitis TaxID=1616125 RepID=A0ABQ2EVP3_9ACTN|nr:GHMP kinase [Streptomyces camponoticapitis]GGK27985.1 kinase [Streptomyces camponoticapitis]